MGQIPLQRLSFSERLSALERFVAALNTRREELAAAIEADGWPRAMADRGVAMHLKTWRVERVHEALEEELSAFGGARALDAFHAPIGGASGARRLRAPGEIIHLWPALPGAGLTPLLYGWLLGARQIVRPSSRGQHFAQTLQQISREVDGEGAAMELHFGAPSERWRQADAIIASGSDETIASLREFLSRPGHRARPTLLAYGHRVSFAVIVDDASQRVLEQADRIALDAVMWHQQGCFSARAVIFCGARSRSEAFALRLGQAIAACEEELDAGQLDEALLARRAQARGVAELLGLIHGDGIGWAQPTNSPWLGHSPSPHVLTVHTIDSLRALPQAIKVPPYHLQAAALDAPRASRRAWCEALSSLGVTRLCARAHSKRQRPSGLMTASPTCSTCCASPIASSTSKEKASQGSESPWCHEEMPSTRIESPWRHEETPSTRIESLWRHHETPSTRIESLWRHEEMPSTRIESLWSRPELRLERREGKGRARAKAKVASRSHLLSVTSALWRSR